MDIYHAWCDLKPGVSDIAFSGGATKYLSHLGRKRNDGWLADHTSEAWLGPSACSSGSTVSTKARKRPVSSGGRFPRAACDWARR